MNDKFIEEFRFYSREMQGCEISGDVLKEEDLEQNIGNFLFVFKYLM